MFNAFIYLMNCHCNHESPSECFVLRVWVMVWKDDKPNVMVVWIASSMLVNIKIIRAFNGLYYVTLLVCFGQHYGDDNV